MPKEPSQSLPHGNGSPHPALYPYRLSLSIQERGQVERVYRTALYEPDRHSALHFLHAVPEDIDTPLAWPEWASV
jgi:hypothetical protein